MTLKKKLIIKYLMECQKNFRGFDELIKESKNYQEEEKERCEHYNTNI